MNDAHQEAAQRAADAGEPVKMLEELAHSGFLEGLQLSIAHQFSRLDDDDVRWVIGKALDDLGERIGRGERKRDIFPYLLKAARNQATTLVKKLPPQVSYDGPLADKLDGTLEAPDPVSDEERERIDAEEEARRRTQIQEVRRLIPRIPQARPRQVMGFIFDALEQGIQDLTNAEISDGLGISRDNVKAAKSRGFSYLIDLAKEAGSLPSDFELYERRLTAEEEDQADRTDNECSEYDYEFEPAEQTGHDQENS